MKLRQLRAVTAIADKGSLREAARYLGMSQPALTQSIGVLERELGAALFERRARGMVPTPVGALFIRRAKVIASEAERAQEEVRQFVGGETGSVDVCLSVVPQLTLLPTALPLFRQRYPEVRLRITEGSFPLADARLRDGTTDFYIGAMPERAPSSELLVEKLFGNTRAVFCRPEHPLARARSLRELVDAHWITTGITDKAENEFEQLFASHGLPAPRVVLQVSSALSLMMGLLSSDALAISLRQYSDLPPARGAVQVIPIRETIAAPDIVIIRRAALPLTPAADMLCDMFRRASAAYVAGLKKARR